MLPKDKKSFLKLIVAVYILCSLPPVFYTARKIVKKIITAHTDRDLQNINEDVYLPTETGGGVNHPCS